MSSQVLAAESSRTFENLGLQPQLMQAVEQLGYISPTPIQLEAIPALLAGRSVLGQAQTGTGKTAAFVLPMLQKIEPGLGPVQGLVLAPTRELAIQVAEAAARFAQHTPTRILPVYGGQSYTIQTRQLRRGVDLVVGTPGRLLDLVRQEALDLSQVHSLVLDEADEMLEMGFIEDVETILAQAPAVRQMALFSATLPEAVRRLADRYLSDPYQITINPTRRTVAETEQRYCRVRDEHKLEALARLLEFEDVKSALIFARTKLGAQELADGLAERGYLAEALHGDLTQARREYVLNRFRLGVVTLLVATDVAARGLDIENVSHVFNYDAPQDAEDYIHRIGRTGRAGRKGVAISLIAPSERGRLRQIEGYTRQSLREMPVPSGEEILARRDGRFIQRLADQLVQNDLAPTRALLAQLVDSGIDPLDIAAAAVQMARFGETVVSMEALPRLEERHARQQERPQPAAAPQRDGGQDKPSRKQPGERGMRRPVEQPEFSRRRKGQGETGMVRLVMNLGNAHGLHPSDVVGAIASEVGIPGKAIGEIDIRREHTFVDVAEQHVRQVLRKSDGRYYLRGKPVQLSLAN